MGKAIRKIGKCSECGTITEHHARGLCVNCYNRQLRQRHREVCRQLRIRDKAYFLENFKTIKPNSATSDKNGYKVVVFKNFSTYEHRWIMMKEMGRPLFGWETVHHINGNKLDNRPKNLTLFLTNFIDA